MFVCYDKCMDLARTNTKIGANIVIESTGLFLTKETAQKYIIAGAHRADDIRGSICPSVIDLHKPTCALAFAFTHNR